MDYFTAAPSPFEFGQKSAAGWQKKLGPILSSALGTGKRVGSVALEGVPLAAGGLAGTALYNSPMVNPGPDASMAEKLEAGVTAGALGIGAGLFADPKSYLRVAQKTMRSAARNKARKMTTPYLSTFYNHAKNDIFKPKAVTAGLALVPPVVLKGIKTVDNLDKTTENIAGVSDTWKQLADSAGAKDQSGKDVVTKLREALEQVSGDATRASGAMATGAESVSKDVAQGVQDVTGTITQGTKDITGALAGAAKSTEGMAEAGKSVAEGLKPLGELVGEITTKDEQGKSIIANLNRVAANAAEYTDPAQGELKKQLESYGATLNKLKQYAPYVGGGLAGAAGLYALYRLMSSRKKKKEARPEFRPGYGY